VHDRRSGVASEGTVSHVVIRTIRSPATTSRRLISC